MIYDTIAPFYDAVNGELDYAAWADFLEEIIRREYHMGRPELVLDLGCGTGRMTRELAMRGYDMTGVDYSVEMLDRARTIAERHKPPKPILWLCQDIREFELYGTVDVTVSCLDTINHLTTRHDLETCFSLVHNYLIPDGLFLFDVNGKHKFETVYAKECYTAEEDGNFCVWQNDYNPRTHICDFWITVFEKCGENLYRRQEDGQQERMYTIAALQRSLSRTGFEFIGAYSDFDRTPARDLDDRIYIVARCKK